MNLRQMKVGEKATAKLITTNKGAVYEVFNVVKDIEEITKELKFQANQAKRDPDDSAQVFLDAVMANFFRLEGIMKRAKKDLGI